MKHKPNETKSTRQTRRVLVTLELETALTRAQLELIARAVFTTQQLPPSRVEQFHANTIRRR